MDAAPCFGHPSVQACTQCSRCLRPVCELCCFAVGKTNLCSDCVTSGPSPHERSSVFSGGLLSVVLAVLGFAITAVLLLLGASGGGGERWAGLLSFPWLGCSIGGLAVAVASRDGARRTGSLLPAVGTWTNGALVALQLVLTVVGHTR